MNRRTMTLLVVGLASAVSTGVIWYNYWALCCGRCTVQTFFTPGPWGISLLGLAGAGTILNVGLKVRQRRRFSRMRCACGQVLAGDWNCCPWCGKRRDT